MRPLALIFALPLAVSLVAQTPAPAPPKRTFTDVKILPHTPVKNQAQTGTCWCFGTVALIESEIIRKGKGEIDLSEMHLVRAAYPRRAEAFIRLHGAMDWGQGAQNIDALNSMSQVGLVPQEAYTGRPNGEKNHNHSELNRALGGFLNGVKGGRQLSPAWPTAVDGILDAYLGKPVTSFTYGGRTWTPMAFMKDHLQIDPADYVAIASFTQYAPYTRFRLPVPDNWSHYADFHNIPFDEFASLLDSAIENGFTYSVAQDVSEIGFQQRRGYALLLGPDAKAEDEDELHPVTPELKAKMFDDWRTTDDHMMHCVGTAKDDKGNTFYLIKNSWGTENSEYKGFIYESRNYMLAKTLYITIHKDALPQDLRAKLGIR